MKTVSITCLLFILFLSSVQAQTAKEYFESGLAKHKSKDYEAAIKDYDKAIKADKTYADAYYNRGNCELALKDMKSAMSDYTSAIKANPQYDRAYYGRASINVGQQKYAEALTDLDKLIELVPAYPNALSLRGQIRVQTDNKKGGCEDFAKAKELGDPQADKYIDKFCSKEETLTLALPENENWKVGDDQDNKIMRVIDYVHKNETLDNWTELVNTTKMKGITGLTMDKAMELMYDQAKKGSPKAKITFIEKDEKAAYPWIIFEIDNPVSKEQKTPESQLWYIVQGKQSLYSNFIAVKKNGIPADLKEKWIKILKQTKLK
jgi:tetratricopeptide (TPR) repeat protein